MAEPGLGAKAGAIAGLVWGVLEGITVYAVFQIFYNTILSNIQSYINSLAPSGPISSIPASQLLGWFIEFAVAAGVLVGIIGGPILGLIFSAAYKSFLKSQPLPIRGLVFGIVLWLIDLALTLPGALEGFPIITGGGVGYGMGYLAITQGVGFGLALLYGYLLGYLFARLGPKVEKIGVGINYRPSQ